jgi:hypothetical protein
MKKLSAIILIFLSVFISTSALAWHDLTHIAVGKTAKFDQAYNLAAPDVAKIKAGNVEEYNHWVNNPEGNTITADMVRAQIPKYNVGTDNEKTGHLYGAIVASIRDYKTTLAAKKYATYHLAYAGHYIGDLSMPLHNMDHNEFNILNHSSNDRIVEDEVSNNIDRIKIYLMTIRNEDDLIQYIVDIAQKAKALGYSLQRENRNMTKEEAYQQLSQSASLFKAVLVYVGYPNSVEMKNNPPE